MTQLNCSICFVSGPELLQITEIDKKERSYLSKLQNCVSDVEWKESFMICDSCVTNLDTVYEFREKCLNSDNLRKKKKFLSKTKEESNVIYEISFVQPEAKLKKSHQYDCDHCDESFKTSTKLVSHSVQEHRSDPKNVKPFRCHECNHRFSTSSNLIQHLKYHQGERTHMCTFCGKTYITKNDLSVHERIHLNRKEYECVECHKCFNTHKDLRSHKYVVHTDPNLWHHVCEICSKRFPVKSNFDTHMRRHRNERNFGCHLCEKKFVTKSSLQKHVLTHSNNKAFTCDLCNKEYKDERVMRVHQKRIHGIGDIKVSEKVKKHLCHQCPKSYYDRNKLTKHLYSHTGEKPHVCKVCQKKFVDGTYLKQHLKKVHEV